MSSACRINKRDICVTDKSKREVMMDVEATGGSGLSRHMVGPSLISRLASEHKAKLLFKHLYTNNRKVSRSHKCICPAVVTKYLLLNGW